jgi:hypothetical protein
MPKTAFQTAERYITLSKTWEATDAYSRIKHINEMILMPLIAAIMSDPLFFFTSFMTAWGAWVEYAEFVELNFVMQRMQLEALRRGGPFIVTNDPTYLPYVWADAVTRKRGRPSRSGKNCHHSCQEEAARCC